LADAWPLTSRRVGQRGRGATRRGLGLVQGARVGRSAGQQHPHNAQQVARAEQPKAADERRLHGARPRQDERSGSLAGSRVAAQGEADGEEPWTGRCSPPSESSPANA
jgi:hypothetical protein